MHGTIGMRSVPSEEFLRRLDSSSSLLGPGQSEWEPQLLSVAPVTVHRLRSSVRRSIVHAARLERLINVRRRVWSRLRRAVGRLAIPPIEELRGKGVLTLKAEGRVLPQIEAARDHVARHCGRARTAEVKTQRRGVGRRGVLHRSPISPSASESVSEPRSFSFLTRYSGDLSAQCAIIDQYTGVDG
jgi:hypothetical protein